MNLPVIPLFKPYIAPRDELIPAIESVLYSGQVGQGPAVEHFEREFSEYIGAPYCVAVSSCTAALHIALILIGSPERIFTTPMTAEPTNMAILHERIVPVFLDSHAMTGNIICEPKRSARHFVINTAVAVDYGGIPVDLDSFRHMLVIEDAAHALGAKRHGRMVGQQALFTTFSFQAIKHITCFPPESKVIVPRIGRNGSMSKRIADIKIGDTVLTYNVSTAEKECKKVTRIFENRFVGNMNYLKLSNGNEIETTPNHELFVIGKGWVDSSGIQIGDRLLQYKYYGLVQRLIGIHQRGKTIEEIYGQDSGQEKRKKRSERMTGTGHHLYGRPCSEETKSRISKGEKGKTISDESKEKMSIAHRDRWNKMSIDKRLSFSDKLKMLFENNPDRRILASQKAKASLDNPIIRKKISDGVLAAMKNPIYWEHYFDGVNRSPNRSETKLFSIINSVCPDEFGYNGDFSLGVQIGGLIPDFVNTKEKRKVIELFGDYWHSEKIRGVSIDTQIHEKQQRYLDMGYQSLFVLESEMKDVTTLKNRIETFSYNPNVEIVSVVAKENKSYDGNVYNLETEDNHNYFVYGLLVHNCGDGGMLVCKNKEDAERARRLRWFGIDRNAPRESVAVKEVGYKYNMNDLTATIGLVQLRHANEIVEAHRANAKFFAQELQGVQVVLHQEPDDEPSYWFLTILSDKLTLHRPKIMAHMNNLGIACGRVHRRNDEHPIFSKYQEYLPGLNSFYDRMLHIPCGWWLNDSDRERIVNAVNGWRNI